MKIYDLDLEKTTELFRKVKRKVKRKQCYINVCKTLVNVFDYMKDIKICYGYMIETLQDVKEYKICVRHCFYKLDNKIIDPTYFFVDHTHQKEIKYIIFKEYTWIEYNNLLDEFDTVKPSLNELLLEEEIKLFNDLQLYNKEHEGQEIGQLNIIEFWDLMSAYYKENIYEGIEQYRNTKMILPLEK